MRKLLLIAIAIVTAVGVAVGVIVFVRNTKKPEKYEVVVVTTTGGDVSFIIDSKTYTVPGTYTVEEKSKIKLTAQPNANFDFIDWTVNNISYSTSESVVVTIKTDTIIKANFEVANHNLTILDSSDSSFSETKVFSASNNLLDYLNSQYSAPNGYYYTYQCNGEDITESTIIYDDAKITRTKNLINYTITFKNGNEVVESKSYTVESQNVIAPNYPEFENSQHYVLTWSEYSLFSSTEIVVNLIKTPIEYTAKLIIPDFCSFVGREEKEIVVNYTIEDSNIQFPEVVVPAHYNYAWPENYTLGYDVSEPDEIKPQFSAIEYVVTYALPEGYTFDGTDLQTKEVKYTIENVNSTQAPALPTANEHYTLDWETEVTSENLGTITINAIETPVEYTANLTIPEGCSFVGHEGLNLSVKYTIEDESLELPEVIAPEHYTVSWQDYTLTYNDTPVSIGSTVTPIDYVVTFKNGDAVVEIRTYNCLNISITEPEVPSVEGYNCSWEEYDLNSLKDLTVNLKKEIITYYATFMHKGEEVAKLEFNVENMSITKPAIPANDADYVYIWNKYTLKLEDMTIESKALRIHSIGYTTEIGDIYYRYNKVAYDAETDVVYIVALNNTLAEAMRMYNFAYNLIVNSDEGLDLIYGDIPYFATSVDDLSVRLKSVLSDSEKQTITLSYESY